MAGTQIKRPEKDTKNRTQVDILIDIRDSIQQASGACSQLIHSGGNPMFWITVRDALELMLEGLSGVAVKESGIRKGSVIV